MNKSDGLSTPLIIGIAAGAFLLVVIAVVLIIVLLKKKKAPGHVKVDQEFMENMIKLLGGKNNIKSVSVENARLKIEVDNLDFADLDGLKTLSGNGVFVTGNMIKTLFKYESEVIKQELNKILK